VQEALEEGKGTVDGRVGPNVRQSARALVEAIRGGQNGGRGVLTGWQMAAPTKPAEAQHVADAYERFKEPLLQKARGWFPPLRGMELDLYQSAWEALLKNTEVEDLESYLERAVFTKGLDELRRRERKPAISLERLRLRRPGTRRVSRGLTGAELVADATTPLPEDRVQLRQEGKLALELLDELTPLQQRIVALRWGWRVPRSQAARLLGISERTLRRELEDAASVIAANARLVEEGRWCERKRSLILAYSFEFLSAGRAAKAEQHLEGCPACRQVVLELRRRIAGVSAAAPLPLSLLQPAGRSLVAMASELIASTRDVLSNLAAAAKHHVLGFFARTPAAEAATSQLAAGGGLRGGGGVLAALAACLVAGGSAATYCSLEGVPQPLKNLALQERQQERNERPVRNRPADLGASGAPAAPLGTQTTPQGTSDQGGENPAGAQVVKETPSSVPEQTPMESAPSPAPKSSPEFGAASAATSGTGAAPAPAAGGGEFAP
jgi:RNA polymerase sigma factor (sigma-70 family)